MQTVILRGFDVQIIAPYEIWEMPQLRHLEFKRFYLPDPIPSDQEEECIVLRNLHTLRGVENLRLTQEVCKRMPNVKKLSLVYDDVHFPGCEASSYYCSHNLGRFNKLESLKCKFGNGVVLSFTFPTSLIKLCLRNCHLQWEGLSMMIASLPHLRYLQLGKLEGPEWNLVDEEFSSLRLLEISCCEDLICWNANSSHFPVLEYLNIFETPKLGEIPFDIGEVPTLKAIALRDCSMCLVMSALRIVMEQVSLNNHELQLHMEFVTVEQANIFPEEVRQQGLRLPALKVIILRDCNMCLAMSALRILMEQMSLDNLELQLHVVFVTGEQANIFHEEVRQQGLPTNRLHIYCPQD